MDMWRGVDQVLANMLTYEGRVRAVVLAIADYLAPMLESYAKEHAPWTDRTGNARQGLSGFVEEISQTIVDIYISHGVTYGVFLETRWAGRWGVLWSTIQAHLPIVTQMLEDALG